MEADKVVKTLKSFSKEEFRLFSRYVVSPLHNKHKEVITLFLYLKDYIKGRKRKLEAEALYDLLFPGQTYNRQKLHHVKSYLLKVTEDFLAWNQWQGDKTSIGISMLRALYKHSLSNQFEQYFKKLEKQQTAQAYRNAEFYHQQYQLKYEQSNYAVARGSTRNFDFQEWSEIQDIAYMAEKLKNACILSSLQAFNKTTFNMGLLEHVLDYLKAHEFLNIPAIGIYYHGYITLNDLEDDAHFLHLKQMISAWNHQFPQPELKIIFILAINCCIKKANMGRITYLKELFELYKLGLDIEVFLENGILSQWTYSNIIAAGLKLKAYDWVKEFIYSYKEKLPSPYRENFFKYNLAEYYYKTGAYDKAMPLLIQTEYQDLLHKLSARAMLAKMYYELEEEDALYNLLKSFEVFIQRKKNLGYHKEVYMNTISFLKKLMALNPYDKSQKEQLRENIAKTKTIAEKEWFLEQLRK